MKRLLLITAALAALACPALAAETPPPGALDARVRTVDYDPRQVYRIVGTFRTATQIVFSPSEEIAHVALGDTVGWEVAAEGHLLFIKPRERTGATNLIVATRRGGEIRNYTFELRTRQGPIGADSPETFFQVRFTYPADEQARELAAVSADAAALEKAIVTMQLERGVLEGPRSFAYTVQGAMSLQPSEVSDNGRFTVLRFPAGQAVPAIYAVSTDGAESLVPFDVRDEFVVIHATGPQFRLRRGREVLCIYNEAYEPYGTDPGTNTASADVERTVREGGQR